MKQRIKESHSLCEEWITIYLVEPLAPLLWAKPKEYALGKLKKGQHGFGMDGPRVSAVSECLTVSTLGKDTSLPSAPLGKTCVC